MWLCNQLHNTKEMKIGPLHAVCIYLVINSHTQLVSPSSQALKKFRRYVFIYYPVTPLYRTAKWHALAKLWMHSDSTTYPARRFDCRVWKVNVSILRSDLLPIANSWASMGNGCQISRTNEATGDHSLVSMNSLFEMSSSSHSWPQPSSGSGPKTKGSNVSI
jgi:hypothetical protein